MIGGVLGITGVLDLYTHWLHGQWDRHRRQMRAISGQIANDNLALHCNSDLSNKIKISHLLSWVMR